MNAQDAIAVELAYTDAYEGGLDDSVRDASEIVDAIRGAAGWDGATDDPPPIVVIMGDGTLTQAKRVPLWSDGLLYRLVSPEEAEDARALEALGPELLAHIDNMEAE